MGARFWHVFHSLSAHVMCPPINNAMPLHVKPELSRFFNKILKTPHNLPLASQSSTADFATSMEAMTRTRPTLAQGFRHDVVLDSDVSRESMIRFDPTSTLECFS